MAKLFFNYGSMNAGKSLNLIKDAFNYEESGKAVITLKPAIDTRDGEGLVKSRIGVQRPAISFSSTDNLFDIVSQKEEETEEKIFAVFVDEAQFMTKAQVSELSDIVDNLGIPVLCYGLRTDAFGNLFEGSQALFCMADEFNEIKAMCVFTNKKATHVLRTDKDGKVIKEGSSISIQCSDKGHYLSCSRFAYKVYMKVGYVDLSLIKGK